MTTSIMKNTVSLDLVITTPQQLKEAFKLWTEYVQSEPANADFNTVFQEPEVAADRYVEYFLYLLSELNGQS